MKLGMFFTDEECLYINELFKNERLHILSKDTALKKLSFAREAATDDEDVIHLIEETYSKIKDLSNEQWEELKGMYPLATNVNSDDEEEKIG